MQTLSRLGSWLYFKVLIGALTRTQCWLYRAAQHDRLPRARAYQPGDERGIGRLFQITFRKRKSLSRWRWEFLENPYGKPNVVVLRTGRGAIVGHLGGIVVRFNAQGDLIPISQGADIMIHPAFRGRPTYEHLMRAHIEDSRNNGVKLLYGFNERAVARANRRFFNFELAPVREWVLEIGGAKARPAVHGAPGRGKDLPDADGDGELDVFPVNAFDHRADALWERVKAHHPWAVVRDSRYLNWRYSPRSNRHYLLWQAVERSSGELLAIAVLAETEDDGLILELLSHPEEANVGASLLHDSVLHFSRAGKSRVRAWLRDGGSLGAALETAGFRGGDSSFSLNLLPLDQSLDRAALKENFYYTLGDYDVY